MLFRSVGDGPLERKLKLLSRDLNLLDNVHFLGRKEDVASFLSSLDLFILTSRYEGFGLVLLEAMDFKIPIVASNISAIPEVLGVSHPGLFMPESLDSLVRKVKELLLSDKIRELVLDIQKSRLASFSVDRYLMQHLEIYQKYITRRLINK